MPRTIVVRRAVLRVFILLGIIILSVIAALMTPSLVQALAADVQCNDVWVNMDFVGCVYSEAEEKVDANPDCGKNPYTWNAIGGHYERKFDCYCLPYTNDPNECEYDRMWLNETPLVP